MRKLIIFTVITMLASAAFLQAQQKDTLAVTKITAGKSLSLKIASENKSIVMGRITEALTANLTHAFQSTRRFEVLTRSDLDAVSKEADLSASGNASVESGAAQGALKGAKYIVSVEITDFQDYTEKARFESLERTAEKRILRLGAVASVINSTTGAILETSSVSVNESDISDLPTNVSANGNLNDSLIAEISRILAERIAQNICDAISPARALDYAMGTLSFNRGANSGVKVGDVYEIFHMGKALIDPETGEKLGNNEIYVGTLTVNRVNAKFSQGVPKLSVEALNADECFKDVSNIILRKQKAPAQNN